MVLSQADIQKMRVAGKLAARILAQLAGQVRPGITTDHLNQVAHELTLSLGATPAPLGYRGYPKSICTSVNQCICHGVPGPYSLQAGDIVNIDITCIKEGFHGDTSRTFYVGEVSERARAITHCAYEAMWKGIRQVRAGSKTGDIGFAINKYVTRQGFYPVKEIGGHGIGRHFHEDPFVPSFGKKGKGVLLQSASCITVEPMINETAAKIVEAPIPGSKIQYYETADKCLSAQFEHTVLVQDGECEVLTLPEEDFKPGY